jgi:hypothetical protein
MFIKDLIEISFDYVSLRECAVLIWRCVSMLQLQIVALFTVAMNIE